MCICFLCGRDVCICFVCGSHMSVCFVCGRHMCVCFLWGRYTCVYVLLLHQFFFSLRHKQMLIRFHKYFNVYLTFKHSIIMRNVKLVLLFQVICIWDCLRKVTDSLFLMW